MICLALVGMVGVSFWSGASLAARIGQTTARQTDSPTAPKVSLSDLIAAARQWEQ
jgi:hypothetical protein